MLSFSTYLRLSCGTILAILAGYLYPPGSIPGHIFRLQTVYPNLSEIFYNLYPRARFVLRAHTQKYDNTITQALLDDVPLSNVVGNSNSKHQCTKYSSCCRYGYLAKRAKSLLADCRLSSLLSQVPILLAGNPSDFLQSLPTYWFMANVYLSGSRTYSAGKGCYVVYSIVTTDEDGEEGTTPGYFRQGREGNNALQNDWGKRSE